jgi:zinc/manganese transport system permease protein
MNQALSLLAAPLALCLILAGMHCYLGLHVLRRGVIFIDLSLAQVAAFGYTLALSLGGPWAWGRGYGLALACTWAAGALFALARRRQVGFSQEALIGVVYALGAAAVLLLADKLPHGAEAAHDLLVGQVLWTTWPDVLETGAIYATVGLVHYLCRGPLLRLSAGENPPHAARWDFLFYALFGVVISSSVRVAGVLQVFCYLIVPALVSGFYYENLRARLLFGWALGAVLTVLALAGSYALDLPTGPAVVALFAGLPVLAVIFWPWIKGRRG